MEIKQKKEETLSIRKTPNWIQSDIKLTIGVLVSNNITTIRKCMESLQPILKAIKSELIVVDTVGEEKSDGSLAVAKEYADKVFYFKWCNDFAAARNICLEHAKGEWFLFVDDDEWIEDVQEIVDFFQNGESNQYAQALYYIRNYLEDESYSTGLVARFIHRTENTRFVGKVHETFNENYLPKKLFSIYANHSGYAYRSEQERKKKHERNIQILEDEIKEKGLNAHRAAQMVQELLSNKSTEEKGYQYCVKYIKELEHTRQLETSCGQWLLVASVRYFTGVGNYEQLFSQAKLIRSKYVLSHMAELALAVTVIFPAVQEDKVELVTKYSEIYFKNWDWIKANEEEALLQIQLDFPLFLTEEYYQKIVYIAAVTANYRDDYQLANTYWKRLPWNKEGFDGSRYVRDLQITMDGLQKFQEWNSKELKGKEMNEVVTKNSNLFDNECFDEDKYKNKDTHVQKLLNFLTEGQLAEALDYIAGLTLEERDCWEIENITGVICSYCGEFEEALSFFRKALEHHEDDPEIYYNLADAYFYMKEYQQAKLMLQCCEQLTEDEALLNEITQMKERIASVYAEEKRFHVRYEESCTC